MVKYNKVGNSKMNKKYHDENTDRDRFDRLKRLGTKFNIHEIEIRIIQSQTRHFVTHILANMDLIPLLVVDHVFAFTVIGNNQGAFSFNVRRKNRFGSFFTTIIVNASGQSSGF